jgi:5-methylcytosine-specific restriction endonuclease McrA
MEPWCRDHGGRGEQVQAVHVHHIVPKRRGGTDDHVNLMSLCEGCHNRRTGSGQ